MYIYNFLREKNYGRDYVLVYNSLVNAQVIMLDNLERIRNLTVEFLDNHIKKNKIKNRAHNPKGQRHK